MGTDVALVCDALQAAVVLTNTYMLIHEWRQLRLTVRYKGWADALSVYSRGWNLIDLLGIVALYVAAAAHFGNEPFVLEQVGAVGVLANAFSLLQLLQPFQATGTLIKVITSTIQSPDIIGFVGVLCVLIWGFSAAFCVSMPTNTAFFNASSTLVVPGLLTSWFAMLGDFDVDAYSNNLALVMFLVSQFIVLIVMFNVLIAIVSDIFSEVMETAEVEVRKLRATTIIDAQALMGKAARRNEAHFPHYLEVLQPHVATPPSEVSELRAEIATVESNLQVKVEGVESNLQSKVESVEGKVEGVEGKVDAMADDVAKIMQLLQPK